MSIFFRMQAFAAREPSIQHLLRVAAGREHRDGQVSGRRSDGRSGGRDGGRRGVRSHREIQGSNEDGQTGSGLAVLSRKSPSACALPLGPSSGDRVGALPLQDGQVAGDDLAQLAAVHDHVDRTLLHQELGALEPFGQLFTHGLLDHARAGKADQRLGFGDDHVAHEGEAGRHAAHGGVGQDADERQAGSRQARQHGIGLGHLHQRQQAFLHPCAAGGGVADEGGLLFDRGLDAAREALAHHRAHGSAHEFEFEAGHDHADAVHRAAHDDEGIGLAGVLQRFLEPFGVFAAVLELQGVDRQHFLADFIAPLAVQERVQPGTRADAGGGDRTSGRR
ncbi:hypothetical protein Ddc_23824 [Ditylenchus destructor]|nr:hypothetical protein Ddc_23824 [Ditylenchus destructor]